MQSLALYIGFGLVTASILCLGAVSFTLQFGISNLFNLAFGATMTAAAFVAYVCNAAGLNIWVSLALGSLSGSLLSFLLNRAIYLPFRRRAGSMFAMIMVTLGVGIIIQYTIEAIWGADNRSYNMVDGAFRAFRWHAVHDDATDRHRNRGCSRRRRACAASLHPARQGDAGGRRERAARP